MELFAELWLYLQYPFVKYAFISGIMIALCSSLFGATLVLKRFSFIGDGLAHAAFGAMAIASVTNISHKMALTLPLTVLAAVWLLRGGQNTRIKGDAAIAMLSVGSLALGYLLMHLFAPSANITADVCSTLFGSTAILTLTEGEAAASVVLSVVTIIFFIFFYNKIFAITFDEDFARAAGTKVDLLNLLIAFIIAVIIVLSMNLVGSLLIAAFVIFPALAAMRLFRTFRAVTVASAVFSSVCAFLGLTVSIIASTPVGATIVASNLLAFLLCYALGWKLGR